MNDDFCILDEEDLKQLIKKHQNKNIKKWWKNYWKNHKVVKF